MSEALLRIRGLRKEYGGRAVLESIDLDVAEHQVVCLIGGSGSGKSTLLRCVDLLDTVDDGTIHLGSTELTDPRLNADAARRRIGVVFQSYNLFPHMSVLDNVTLAPRRAHRIPRREAAQRARELLERLGLAEKASDYPDRLSGGQQQRVAIARAIVKEPKVLLADEPTGNLDEETRDEIVSLLEKLWLERGLTMILITHDSAVAKRAQRVGVMKNGNLTVLRDSRRANRNPKSGT